VAKDLIKASGGTLSESLSGIRAPERKLIVMIIGNHSAGKSSFINWYVEEDIQKAKVSIETIEINLIMKGKAR
jgi:GTPase SAR1 family protein